MSRQQPQPQLYRGISAVPGCALGELFFISPQKNKIQEPAYNNTNDRRDLEPAVNEAVKELYAMMKIHTEDSQAKDIIEFQVEMLQDNEFLEQVLEKINESNSVLSAWQDVLNDEISDYKNSDDEYFQARASDLLDIKERVSRLLTGNRSVIIPEHCVVVADDLAPSEFLSTNWGSGGIALLHGSVNSHVAMLARSRNIPMLVNLESLPDIDTTKGFAFLDAQAGELTVGISLSERERYHKKLLNQQQHEQSNKKFLYKPALLKDQTKVTVQINVADPSELNHLNPQCCDGIGLVRTEFLFHDRAKLPDENEQYQVYRELLQWAQGRPVTVRTLDAGGDKPIKGLTFNNEKNPFLGVRGLRLSLLNQAVFIQQIRALLRASAHGELKVMLPMVTAPEEVEQVNEIMTAQLQQLISEGHQAERPPLGIMVEVPAVAISIELFNADFYSIGSNDLIQYVTAVSRDSSALQYLAQPNNSAVEKLMRAVIGYAADTSKEVSLCGEMAADPDYIGNLLEFGLRNFSVNPTALARTKRIIIESGV